MLVRAYSPSHLGGWGKRIAWTQEAEDAVNWNPTTALQPEQDSVSKKKKEKREKKYPLMTFFLQNKVCFNYKSNFTLKEENSP